MTTISAKLVLCSEQIQTGTRLSTLLLRYPRCIHSEFMTHRMFSRNAASSRAIPVSKLIKDVEEDPFIPLVWTANEPGMQGKRLLSELAAADAEMWWRHALRNALSSATLLANTGAHKQVVNRILEPFAHITVLVSSTSWTNFLALRDHPDAEPHMQILARVIKDALHNAKPQFLRPGEWHVPFIEPSDEKGVTSFEALQVLSVARCASTSYKTVDGFDMTPEKATQIYNRLLSSPMHASPFEHVAQADTWINIGAHGSASHWEHAHQHGNFEGFRQLRKMHIGECQ